MNKIKAKLQALPKERLYIFIIGIIIIFGGIIGAFAPWFSALFGLLAAASILVCIFQICSKG